MHRRSGPIALAGLLAVGPAPGRAPVLPVPPQDPQLALSAPAPVESWLAQAQRSVAAREYDAASNERGLQAPNRAHNLRTYFEADGVRLHDRTAGGDPELVGFRLSAVGRGADARPVPPGEVVSAGARVEIHRPGLVEWYENKPEGLEQGFTIAERPAGAGELSVALDLDSAAARAEGEALLLKTATGRELRYGALVVRDARGAVLSARFEVPEPRRIEIAIDDADARYPLVVDPLISATADARLESNQTGLGNAAGLGISVAGAGDVNGDGYDDVIVGAVFYDAGQTDEGAAFVFLGGPAGVANGNPATANATLQSNQTGSAFGFSVAGAGDVNGDGYDDVIVGATNYSAGQTAEGAAFVFLGGPSGVASGSPATASTTLQSDIVTAGIGGSVAGAGDVNGDGYDDVIVGAPYYGTGTELQEGAAFVFLGGPAGVPSGNTVSANAMVEGNQLNASMGRSVAGAGDVNGDGYDDVIMGATGFTAGQVQEGAAFVFLGGPSGITGGNPATANTTLQSDQVAAFLGFSVASAGDVNGDDYADVIVGAPYYDSGEENEGAAFVFLGGPTGIASGNPASASATLQSNQAQATLGYSVAGAGDVNGDRHDDVIVGAFYYDAGEVDEGAAFVFLGGIAGVQSGSPGSARFTLQANQVNGHLGTVAGAGDVNGDGYGDLIVGAYTFDSGEVDEGAAFLYLGGIAKGDFDDDFKTDLVLRQGSTGSNVVWLMNGTVRAGEAAITPAPTSALQRIVGVADFNADMRSDLLFWNQATGAVELWLMNGPARFAPAAPLSGAPAPPWKPAAVADLNADGRPDIVYRNSATQEIRIAHLSASVIQSVTTPTPSQAVDANWEIVAALDWNGDKNPDLLWYNATSGKIVLWFMNAAVQRIAGQFTNPASAGDNNWNVVAAGDYGIGAGGLPGTKDIVWRNATSGNLVVWHMDKAGNRTSGVFTTPMAPTPNPTDWTVVGPK